MGATSYISSGIIEVYVSGLASSREREELEFAIAQYPEVAAEYQSCQQDMEQYIIYKSVIPPATLKERLLTQLNTEETARANGTYVDEDVIPETPVRKVLVNSAWRWVAAASILLLVGSALLYYNLFTRYTGLQQQYEAVAASNATIAAASSAYRTRLEQAEQNLHIVQDPSMKTVKMQGTKSFPTALVTVYWNPASKEVFVMVNNLPQPSPDKQYQLWAMVDGKPVDMGVFETGTEAKIIQKMNSIGNAGMFAVTLEKKGGSPEPTLDQMYVAGKI
ncbi:anti-sigma factor [Chitinophaga sp.]|uniref:anti-sigma factor n=1 Tax=Chitinophaga sp. TaxID=1869181 RepID=UPI0031D37C21